MQSYREACSVRSVTAWRVASPDEASGLLAVEGEESTTYDGVLFCSNPFGDRHAFGEAPAP